MAMPLRDQMLGRQLADRHVVDLDNVSPTPLGPPQNPHGGQSSQQLNERGVRLSDQVSLQRAFENHPVDLLTP